MDSVTTAMRSNHRSLFVLALLCPFRLPRNLGIPIPAYMKMAPLGFAHPNVTHVAVDRSAKWH